MQTDDDTDFLNSQLVATEALITAYQGAMLALANGAQSYTNDSGQTRLSVTKADLGSMRLLLKGLYETRDELRSRLGFTKTLGRQVHVIPGF